MIIFLSILCKKCVYLENWHGKMELTVWAGGLGVWSFCVWWQCSLWHSQLWHPSIIDAVPLVQPPSLPTPWSELTFFCTISRCFLVALCPLVPAGCSFLVLSHGWRGVFHPAGKGKLQAGPGRLFLHFSNQAGAKSLLSKMWQDDNGSPLMLLVGEGRLRNHSCCSPRWESTQ